MKKRSEIEATANEILERFRKDGHGGAISMPPVPIREICFLNGLSVIPQNDLRHGNKKLVGMLDTLRQAVYFEETDTLGRQNFTIGHELGHYILHWLPSRGKAQTTFVDESYARFFRDTAEDIDEAAELKMSQDPADYKHIEVEANYFAQFILMPADLITEAVRQLVGRLYTAAKKILAQQFEVSEAAMDFRLRTMGLYTEFTRNSQTFFVGMIHSKGEATRKGKQASTSLVQSTPKQAVYITPETRLRTLLDQVKSFDSPITALELDFGQYSRAETGSIGCVQALDIILLQEYLKHLSTSLDQSTMSVQYHISSPHILRHLHRLGVLDHLNLNATEYVASSPSKDTVAGSRILTKLTRVEKGLDSSAMKQRAKENLLAWDTQAGKIADFAEFTGDLIETVVSDAIQRSPLGAYVAAQASRVVKNDVIVGYRVTCASGFYSNEVSYIGESSTSHESLLRILQSRIDTEHMGWLRDQAVSKWQGFIQVNYGDTTINIGKMDTSYLTGLYPIPIFQVIVLANHRL